MQTIGSLSHFQALKYMETFWDLKADKMQKDGCSRMQGLG